MLQVINLAKNRTQVNFEDDKQIINLLVSYKTPVAAKINTLFFITSEFHSVTTSRHINEWLSSFGKTKDNCEVRPQDDFNDFMINDIGIIF